MRYVGIYDIFGYLMETYGITWDGYEKIQKLHLITSYYLIQKIGEVFPIHGICFCLDHGIDVRISQLG